MSEERGGGGSQSRWPEGIAVVLSVVALVVSGFALVAAERQHRDERATEILDQVYEDWEALASPELWEVSHLAEVPETYEHTRDVLRAYAAELPEQEKRRLYLLERTTAVWILVIFEQHLRQWQQAQDIGDMDRKVLLDLEIDFYADIYLRNPRLLWYWSPEGGNIVAHADPPTVEFFNRRVLDNPELPLQEEPDPDGILPGFTGL